MLHPLGQCRWWAMEYWLPHQRSVESKRREKKKEPKPVRVWDNDTGTTEDYIEERVLVLTLWLAPNYQHLRSKPSWTKQEVADLVFGRQVLDIDPDTSTTPMMEPSYPEDEPSEISLRREIQKSFLAFFQSAIGEDLWPSSGEHKAHFRVTDVQEWVKKHGIRPGYGLENTAILASKKKAKKPSAKRGRPSEFVSEVESKIYVSWQQASRPGRWTLQKFLEAWPSELVRPKYLNTEKDFSDLLQRVRARERRKR